MKRYILILMMLAAFLTGCSRNTTVYIPEETAELETGIVVYIPVRPTEEAESQPTEPAVEEEPTETEPEQKNSSTVSKKTTTSSNKGSSTSKGETNKGTVTGSSSEPAETKPAATEPTEDKHQVTVTIPAVTEPPTAQPTEEQHHTTVTIPVTEPPVTETPETEPPATEPPTTDPPVTEPPATEPPTTEPAATEPPVTEPPATESAATEPPATEPPVTEPPETEPPLYDISGYAVGYLEYAILDQINAHRADAGLDALQMDEYLCAIASCRSYEVSLVWSHTRPDGRSFATVLDDYGYGAGGAEELLVYALGFADGTAMADRWMQSDAHRQLLLGSWSTAGIGVYDANGYIYVTCLLVG